MAKNAKVSRTTKIYFTLLLLLSSLLGWLAFQYLNTQRETVFLFADDYEEGTLISGDMLISSEMDSAVYSSAAVQGTKYASIEDVRTMIANGDVLKVPVMGGTPMTVSQALSGGGSALENRLGKYMTSVELDPSLVSGLNVGIEIGSRINLISTFSSETSADGVSTKYAEFAFQDLLVLDVRDDGAGTVLGVSVEVEPSESLRLIHSMNNEKLTAAILKRGSYVPVAGNGMSYAKKYTEDPTSRSYDTGHNFDASLSKQEESLPAEDEEDYSENSGGQGEATSDSETEPASAEMTVAE